MEGGNTKKGSSKGHGNGRVDPGIRKDRRSATGMSGDPKKGGHGGKFTWVGDQRLEDEYKGGAIDAKDPNFVEEEEIEREKLQAQ